MPTFSVSAGPWRALRGIMARLALVLVVGYQAAFPGEALGQVKLDAPLEYDPAASEPEPYAPTWGDQIEFVPHGTVVLPPTKLWHPGPVQWTDFSQDEQSLFTLCSRSDDFQIAPAEFTCWSVATGERKRGFPLTVVLARTFLPGEIAASRDAKVLAIADAQEGVVRVWDGVTGHALPTLELDRLGSSRLAISAEGDLLAVASRDPRPWISVWRLPAGRREHLFRATRTEPVWLRFSDDGKVLLTAEGNIPRRYDLKTGEVGPPRTPAERCIVGGCFSRDGKQWAAGGWLFDVESGKKLRRLIDEKWGDHSGRRCIVFSPDGQQLLQTGRGLTSIHLADGTPTGVHDVSSTSAISPQARYVATPQGRCLGLHDLQTRTDLHGQGARLSLRPVVRQITAADPFRVALRVADGPGAGISIPETLRSLSFRVTTPDGKRHVLDKPTVTVLGKDFLRDSWSTYIITLKPWGFTTANKVQRFQAAWKRPDAPSFASEGIYRLSIAGQLKPAEGEGTPFETGETTLEVVPRGLATLAETRQRALDQLRSLLPEELRKPRPAKKGEPPRDPIGDDDRYSDGWGSLGIIDDPSGARVVRFAIYGDDWNVTRYNVHVLADGTPVEITSVEDFTCLAQGTVLETERGPLAVENARVGDRIWGFNPTRGRAVLTTVRGIRASFAPETLLVGGTLQVTAEHPIFASGAWKRAAEIAPDDLLRHRDGSLKPAGPSSLRGESAVFDLTVDDPHTYFAGGMLVHNKSISYPRGWDELWPAFDSAMPLSYPSKLRKRLWASPAAMARWKPGLEVLSLANEKGDDAAFASLANLRHLNRLDLSGTTLTDVGLASLAGLERLGTLDLARTKATGTGLAPFAERRSARLQSLNLADAPIAPAGLKALGALTSLTELDLSGTSTTDDGLAELSRLTRLRRLSLAGTQVTDAGLRVLAGLSDLESLDLSGTQVRGPGLAHVAALPALRELKLSHSQVDSAGLLQLAPSRTLRKVDLSGTRVASAGLIGLAGCQDLSELNLQDTTVDDAGLRVLGKFQRLESLNVLGTQVVGTGFTHLQRQFFAHPLAHWPDRLQAAPIRLGSPGLARLKRIGSLCYAAAEVIEEFEAEQFAWCITYQAQGQITFRPLWVIWAEPYVGEVRRFDWNQGWVEARPFWLWWVWQRAVRVQTVPDRAPYLASFRYLKHVEFINPLHKNSLSQIPRVRGVLPARTLRVGMLEPTNAGLDRLRPFQEIEELSLDGWAFSKAGLVGLDSFPKLRRLTLSGAELTDELLAAVSRSSLTSLTFDYPRPLDEHAMTDAGWGKLGQQTLLEELSLSRVSVPPGAVHHLAALKRLRVLNLDDSELTDDGLAKLSGLTAIEVLDLSHTQITTEALTSLRKLPKLSTLFLLGIAPEIVSELEEGLPKVKVVTVLQPN